MAVDPICTPPLLFNMVTPLIGVCCLLGLIWAFYNFKLVKKIDVSLGVDSEDGSIISISTEQQDLLI